MPATTTEADRERDRRPDEEETGSGIVVSPIGERLPIPLVPLVAQPAVDVDVNELGPGGVRHTEQDS